MSGSVCLNSSPTTENNGKNSSDTSTCNGGIHLCPFQLAPPINQYTYCVLKRICRRILKEILTEEGNEIILVKDDLIIKQNEVIRNDKKINSKCLQNSSSIESPVTLTTKNPHKLSSDSMKIAPKSNKMTQTKNELLIVSGSDSYEANMNKNSFIKEVKKDFVRQNTTIRTQIYKNGLPLILNSRTQVRNGNMLENKT